MLDELDWKRKISLVDSFSWKESGVVLWSSPEPKHHQRQMRDPIGASHSSSQSTLQRSMKPFNHPVALRMKTSFLETEEPKDRANLQPNGGGELTTSV